MNWEKAVLSRWMQLSAMTTQSALYLLLGFWGGAAGWVLGLPLLVSLPGLWRARSYTAAWASLLILFYIAALLSEAFSMPSRHDAALALSALATWNFVSLLLMVRFSARERAARTARTAT
jgi:uncharacterized membrane protein